MVNRFRVTHANLKRLIHHQSSVSLFVMLFASWINASEQQRYLDLFGLEDDAVSSFPNMPQNAVLVHGTCPHQTPPSEKFYFHAEKFDI